ncbi:MAG: hypothetical protein DSZ00_10385 [Gammaproteobacteria bacterium]|nr:MAG: hypothetical protein DSZ00_10385 [Gammaproteobacteria bacterium]
MGLQHPVEGIHFHPCRVVVAEEQAQVAKTVFSPQLSIHHLEMTAGEVCRMTMAILATIFPQPVEVQSGSPYNG